MRAGGCLLLLMVIGVMSVELWFALTIAEWFNPDNPESEYLVSVLGMGVLSFMGYQLIRWRMRRFAQAMMSGKPGPAVVAILGAALITLPGYLTAIPGVLLQLPPIQKLGGRVAASVMSVVMQRMAKRMGGAAGMGGMGGMGGFGGFPGAGGQPGAAPFGNPFAPGSPFAGMQPKPGQPQADQQLRGGKVIETTAERVDD